MGFQAQGLRLILGFTEKMVFKKSMNQPLYVSLNEPMVLLGLEVVTSPRSRHCILETLEKNKNKNTGNSNLISKFFILIAIVIFARKFVANMYYIYVVILMKNYIVVKVLDLDCLNFMCTLCIVNANYANWKKGFFLFYFILCYFYV